MASRNSSHTLESFIPFDVAPNADQLKDIARKELGETPELKEKCLKHLRDLIKDDNLKCITTDEFLLRFLRVKKFDVQRSYRAVQNYSKQRVAINNCLQKLEPETVKNFLRHNIAGGLPYRDAEGRLVVYFRTGAWNPSICSDDDLVMTILLMCYYGSQKECTQISGAIAIIDCTYIPVHYVHYLIRQARTVFGVLLNGLPVRYPAVHIINESVVLKYILRLIDFYITKKMKQRVMFHGSSREIFFENLDPAILPDDFGGSLGPINSDHLTEVLLDYLEKIKDEQQYFIK